MGYETVTRHRTEEREQNYTVHTVNAHEVTAAIQEYASLVGATLENSAAQLRIIFKNDLKQALMDIWAKYEVVEYCSSANRNMQAVQIVSQLPEVSFHCGWTLPADLSRSGKLEEDDAYAFEQAAAAALNELRETYMQDIARFASAIPRSLRPAEMAERVLDKMQRDIEKLSAQIADKENTLRQFTHIQDAVRACQTQVEEAK